jgi:mannose-6-phosphate isomerase-like protein (cupin superfamily)
MTTAVHRRADEGDPLWALGALMEVKLTSDETDGTIGCMLVTQPPGIATPLHVHHREAEIAYLIEGTMTYRAGDDIFHLEPGDMLYLPKATPHAFRITGTAPCKWLGFVLPGGAEALYARVGRPATDRTMPAFTGVPDPEEIARWGSTAPAFGLEVVGPPLAADA